MSTGSRLALVALVVPLLVTAGAAGAPVTGTSPAVADGRPAQTSAVVNETLTVALQPDGDARWRVTATFDLDTDNETAAFRALADEFTAGETASLGLPAFRAAAGTASDVVDREMRITNVTRTSSPAAAVENGTGRLTLAFTWTEFARTDGTRLVVGDAFRTPEGTWLPGLNGDQRLRLVLPERYGVINATSAVPAPQNGTIRWTGPTTFEPGALSLTLTGSPGTPVRSPTTTAGATTATTPTTADDPGSFPAAGAVVLVLALGAAALAYVLTREGGFEVDLEVSGPLSGDADADAPETAQDDGEQPGSESTVDADADTAGTDSASNGEPADEALLSDEERIERLLEQNGGRMRQANIVKETGWSNAKVSQLLSAMDEDDRVDKLRIGRENLISVPDEDVTDLDDPD